MFEPIEQFLTSLGLAIPEKYDGWPPGLKWLHVGCDLFIAIAFIAISTILPYCWRRRNVPYPWVFVLFSLFILASGFVHLIEALMFQYPLFGLDLVLKLITVATSWATLLVLIPIIPRVLDPVAASSQPYAGSGIGDTTLHSLANTQGGNQWHEYLVAIGVAAMVLLCRAVVEPLVEHDYLFVLALLGVVFVSWRSGFGPGILTLFLSMVGMVFFFVPPRFSFAVEGFGNLLATSMFCFCGVCCAGLGEAQWIARRRTKAALAVALDRKAELEVEVARRREAEFAIRQRELELIDVNRKLAASQTQILHDQKQQAKILERKVQERTTELSEEVEERKRIELQLRALTVELHRSNKELEQFAYVASHDLQEPLRKIQAFGDRLKTKFGEVLPEAGKDYVERMHSSASRMRRLIEDLLTFSRVTTQARPFVRIDLKKLAQEVISDLDEYIDQNDAVVEVAELPSIDADPSQMRQLFQNLIANGIKFHRPHISPVIAIHAEPLQILTLNSSGEPVAGYRICFRDNGIGFDEKYLNRIFQVFQRLHGREEYEGTGVGLAICRKIAERHGGSITAQSQPEQGSTFIVTLPICHAAQEAITDVQPEQELSHNPDGRR